MNSLIVTTPTGVVDVINPTPESINIEDIAHNLCHINRYNGSTKNRYTVAQHTLILCWYMEHFDHFSPEDRLYMLLHDATEAYIGDIVSPLKESLPKYKEIEDNLNKEIMYKFGVASYKYNSRQKKYVLELDVRIRANEVRHLLNHKPTWVEEVTPLDLPEPDSYLFGEWPIRDTEELFIQTYHNLKRELDNEL